jgi:hypothetical protein
MPSAARRLRPAPFSGALLAGAVTVGVLTGCGGGSADSADAGSSSSTSASSSAGETASADLAAGLLPAEAFGTDATVTPVSAEELEAGAGLAEDGLQITPESCAAAVKGTQPQVDDYAAAAAETATVGAMTTAEVLLQGGPTDDAVSRLEDAVTNCPEARISSPDIGEATVTFESIPVSDLGDGSAALRFTTTLAGPDGSQVSVPALVGIAQDGDRLVTLLTLSQDGSDPDPVAFATLLEQAFEVQSAALD